MKVPVLQSYFVIPSPYYRYMKYTGPSEVRDPSLSASTSHPRQQSSEAVPSQDTNERDQCSPLPQEVRSTADTDKEAYRLAMEEIESLYTPCNLQFHCSIKVGESARMSGDRSVEKRKRGGAVSKRTAEGEPESPTVVLLCFEEAKGNDRDSVHQIMQYLKNRLK